MCPGHDRAGERVWRHLDTCQYQTFLHARVPRVACPTHGVRHVRVAWMSRGSEPLYAADGALGHRPDPAGQHRDRRVPDRPDHVGRSPRRDGARPRSGARPQTGPAHPRHRRRRESPSAGAIPITRSCAISRRRPPSSSPRTGRSRVSASSTTSSRRSSQDDLAVGRGCAPVREASHHERRRGGPQQQDHAHQAEGRWLPQRAAPHDGPPMRHGEHEARRWPTRR